MWVMSSSLPGIRRLLVAAALGFFAAACGRAPAPGSGPPSAVAPWLALPAAHHHVQARLQSPSPPIPVPAGTPPCSAAQLEGQGAFGGAATGHVDLPVIMRNRGGLACYLEGYADVSIADAAGGLLAQSVGSSGRGTFFADAPALPVVMEPGTAALRPDMPGQQSTERGQAWMNVEWYDCRHRQAASLLLNLPGGGGGLSIPFKFEAPYSPACDVPGQATASELRRGPLTPTGVDWMPRPAFISVAVSIAAPPSVRRGSTLNYAVTLNNESSGEYRLDPCPDYVEILGGKQAIATYELNCSPVGAIPAGGTATFEMRLDIPRTLIPGTTRLDWALMDGRLATPTAFALISLL